ncbi:hypothetical protein GCM10022227_09720 [Streptomyces sedi]
MTDVGLDGAQPQRLAALRPFLAVGGQQRLGLDRVAQGGAGAVRLDGVDVGGGEPGGGEGLLDDALLGGAVGGGQPVGGAVLVDGGAADDGPHAVPVAARVGEAFQHQHAGALAPAGAVGGGGERLDAAVGGEPALAAERGEDPRVAHDGDAAGERQGGLARAQRLARQVQGDQRAGAGGVDGEGGALKSERVGGAAGDHAGRGAGEQVAVEAVGRLVEADAVLLRFGADEDAGGAAAQGVRVEPAAFQGLPAQFEDEPLLRVHRGGLAGADAEEVRVELARRVQERGVPHIALAGLAGVRVVDAVDVPAAVVRQRGEHVPLVVDQSPQGVGRGGAAGVAAADADDGDGLVREGGRPFGEGGAGRGGGVLADERVVQEERDGAGRRMVEDERHRQVDAGGGGEALVQVDGGQRVEAQVLEGEVGAGTVGRVLVDGRQDRLGVGPHEVNEDVLTRGRRQSGEALGEGGLAAPRVVCRLRNEVFGLAHARTPPPRRTGVIPLSPPTGPGGSLAGQACARTTSERCSTKSA